MFSKKKKLLAELESCKQELRSVTEEKIRLEEVNDDFEELKKKYTSLEIESQFLKGKISELKKKVAHYEKIDKVTNIEAQLRSNELKHQKELNERSKENQSLLSQNIKLTSELDLLKLKIKELSQSQKKFVDLAKLQNDLETYSTTNATLNSRITDLEYEVEHYKQRAEENFQSWSEKDKENRRLRAILKLPKNTKLKCEHTVQYKIAVTTKSKTSALYNADIFIVNYSLYTFNDEGYCMKEIEKCAYFLERFYWTKGGYISFCDPALDTAHSAPQIFPDNVFRTYRGNDNKEYSISFSLDFIVEPTPAEILQFSVKKSILASLLSKSKVVHKELKALYDRACHSIDTLGVDFPDQFSISRDLICLYKQYEDVEKDLKNFTKDTKEKFKSKFEKIK